MSPLRILILVFAIAAAGGAAFLARNLVGARPVAVATPAPSIAMTEVLVAGDAIRLGTNVTPEMLRWQPWPVDAAAEQFVRRDQMPDAQMVFGTGAVARVGLLKGEPVTTEKLVNAESSGFLAAALTPGKRAIAIQISAATGAGGFILPNDRVDVILTWQEQSVETGTAQFFSTTVLTNVRVLAIDQVVSDTMGEEAETPSVVGKTATLELSPAEAQMLALADAQGEISLALVSLKQDDGAVAQVDPRNFGNQRASVISVVRYGVSRNTPLTAN